MRKLCPWRDAFKPRSICINRPKVCQENITHTITPPPPWIHSVGAKFWPCRLRASAEIQDSARRFLSQKWMFILFALFWVNSRACCKCKSKEIGRYSEKILKLGRLPATVIPHDYTTYHICMITWRDVDILKQTKKQIWTTWGRHEETYLFCCNSDGPVEVWEIDTYIHTWINRYISI